MSKDIRFDQDRLEHKRQRRAHHDRRAARNHWPRREVVGSNEMSQMPTDLRRFGLRSA